MIKRLFYILLFVSSCTIIEKPSHYPDRMVIESKAKDSVYYNYFDGNHHLWIKSKRFNQGDVLEFKEIGKKYIKIKRVKHDKR